MPFKSARILALNAGSSSIRFAVYACGESTTKLAPLLTGKIDRIGSRDARFHVGGVAGQMPRARRIAAASHKAAGQFLLHWLAAQPVFAEVRAVGHRVVHGMKRTAPARITRKLRGELRDLLPLAPEHLPHALALIEAVRRRYPRLKQVACFDTAFHRTMPPVARLLPIPRRYAARGVVRYGFHGLSYEYLLGELRRLDPVAAKGRVIFAHLGNGASLCAVRAGRSIDTSMGFTPAAGVMMGTRSGDLDPGLGDYFARTEKMSAAQFQRLVNRESGLLGVSATSADLRELLAREKDNARAAEAGAMFCYQVKKWIGSYAAALGGVDALVFAGGIGENSATARARICAGLGFLGIELNARSNRAHAPLISAEGARVRVRVIRTDEELVIARHTARLTQTSKLA